MNRNKKILTIVGVIGIMGIMISIMIISISINESLNQPHITKTYQGISFSIPKFAFTKYHGYDEFEDHITFWVGKNPITITPLIGYTAVYDAASNFSEIEPEKIEDIPNGSAVFRYSSSNPLEKNHVKIIVVNDDASEGVIIETRKDEYIEIANTIIFSNGDKAIDNKQNLYVIDFILNKYGLDK